MHLFLSFEGTRLDRHYSRFKESKRDKQFMYDRVYAFNGVVSVEIGTLVKTSFELWLNPCWNMNGQIITAVNVAI